MIGQVLKKLVLLSFEIEGARRSIPITDENPVSALAFVDFLRFIADPLAAFEWTVDFNQPDHPARKFAHLQLKLIFSAIRTGLLFPLNLFPALLAHNYLATLAFSCVFRNLQTDRAGQILYLVFFH